MTDDRIERLIWREIKKRGITFYDMISLSHYGVDSNPDDERLTGNRNTRANMFKEPMGADRMKELLSLEDKNPYDEYPPLKISLQDLFIFWWDRCIDQQVFVDEILEDIYDYFTEKMRPPIKKKATMDMSLDFDKIIVNQMKLFTTQVTDLNEERLKRTG